MESRSVAYNPTPVPNMGGMMQGMSGMQGMNPGMQGMQGMSGMQGMNQGMPGMNQEMQGMSGMQGMNQGMLGMNQEMQGMNQGMHCMPEMQCMPGMNQEMQGMPEMERMLHGMHGTPGVPGGYQHFDFDPCCQMPCSPCSEPIMEPACPMPMPTPLPTPTPAHEVYVVKPGDSVYKIAKRFGTTMQAIILANNLRNPDRIYPGETLYIPGAYSSKFRG